MSFKPARWPRKLRSQEWYGGTSRGVICHRGWLKNQGYPQAARPAEWKPGREVPAGGYAWLRQTHVMGADTGADLDFLLGCRGNPVGKDSH